MKKYIFLLLVILVGVFTASFSLAASLHKVHLDWDYEDQVVPGESLAGFRLYKEGVLVAQIDDPAARSYDCRFESEEGTFNFTLTAFYSGGTETPHSSPYTFTLSSSTLVDVDDSHNILSSYSLDSSMINNNNNDGSPETLSQAVFSADFSALDESAGTLSPVLVYPHIVADDAWETEICLVNDSQSVNLVGILRPYANDGTPLAGDLEFDLAPKARRELRVSEIFPDPQRIGYLVLAANHDQAAGYAKFFIDGRGGAAVPAVHKMNNGDFSLPLTISAPGWQTIVSLINVTGMEKQLTVRLDNGETGQIVLGPREHKAITIASLFDDSWTGGVASATVENSAGIIGIELFAGDNNKYVCGIPLQDQRSTELSYPLDAGGPGWLEGIFIYNPLSQPCNLTLKSYDDQGVELSRRELVLGGGEKYIVLSNDADLPAGTSWVHMTTNVAVTGFEVLLAADRLGSFGGLNSSSQSGIFARLDDSLLDGWTGVELINPTAETANVNILAYDDAGTLVASHVLSIPPFGKVGGPVADVFPGDHSSATYLKYDSSVALAACQYHNSADDQVLDAMTAL